MQKHMVFLPRRNKAKDIYVRIDEGFPKCSVPDPQNKGARYFQLALKC